MAVNRNDRYRQTADYTGLAAAAGAVHDLSGNRDCGSYPGAVADVSVIPCGAEKFYAVHVFKQRNQIIYVLEVSFEYEMRLSQASDGAGTMAEFKRDMAVLF